MPRAGYAGALQDGLHARFVAEVLRHLGAHAFDTQRVAHLAQRDLQLLEGADQAARRADLARETAHRVGDLLRIEAVVDPVVRRELRSEGGRESLYRVLADEAGAHAGKIGDRLDEAQRRIEKERSDEDDR